MAYTTGTAANINALISALVTFAVTNAGFTNNGTVTSSDGRTVYLVSKGGVHWYFASRTTNDGIISRMGYNGFPAAGNLTSPGSDYQTYDTRMNTWAYTGPFVGHYLFTDGTCVHLCVEVASGIYNHFSFGKVAKYGTWDGGEYVTGGYYAATSGANFQGAFTNYTTRPFNDYAHSNLASIFSYLRIANASVASTDFRTVYGAHGDSNGMFVGTYDAGDYAAGSLYGRLIRDTPNGLTNRTPILPGLVRRFDWEGASGLHSLAGIVPYVGFMKLSADMNPLDIINTDWQVFPVTMRTGGDTTLAASSGEYAIAYRRI